MDLENTIHSIKNAEADPNLKRKKLEKACKDFEALFLAHMLKTMREAGFSDGKESSPMALKSNNPMQGMFDWHMAQDMSARSPLGIAEQLMRSLEPALGDDFSSSGLKSSNISMDKGPLKDIIDRAASDNDVDASLIQAVIKAESNGNRWAVSKSGAKGLMQLMDTTALEMGVNNPFDRIENVNAGSKYLRMMIDRYDGDLSLALAAYNAGPTAVDKHEGIPPYRETEEYVEKVLKDYQSRNANTNK